MFPSLEIKLKRYEELELLLQDPAVMADVDRMLEIQREYGGLQKIALQVREFKELEENIAAAKEMLDEESDAETREYAQAELDELTQKKDQLEEVLEDLATAGDSITRGSLIMEIRAGTGGDEDRFVRIARIDRAVRALHERRVERDAHGREFRAVDVQFDRVVARLAMDVDRAGE